MHSLILIASLIVMLFVISAELYVLATANIAWPSGGQRLSIDRRSLAREKMLGWRNITFFAMSLSTMWATLEAKAPFSIAALAALVFLLANLMAARKFGLFDTQVAGDARLLHISGPSFAIAGFGSHLNLYTLVFLCEIVAAVTFWSF